MMSARVTGTRRGATRLGLSSMASVDSKTASMKDYLCYILGLMP